MLYNEEMISKSDESYHDARTDKMGTRPEFLVAMSRLDEAKPTEIIERLYGLFNAIAQMNPAEVVSAYQSIKMTAQHKSLSETEVGPLLDACEAQMAGLWEASRSSGGSYLGGALDRRFETVLGFPVHWLGDTTSIDKLAKARSVRISQGKK